MTEAELTLLHQYSNNCVLPDGDDDFPAVNVLPDLKEFSGSLLKWGSLDQFIMLLVNKCTERLFTFCIETSLMVELILFGGLHKDVGPEWRSLYKPPAAERVADLQWRVLHGSTWFYMEPQL